MSIATLDTSTFSRYTPRESYGCQERPGTMATSSLPVTILGRNAKEPISNGPILTDRLTSAQFLLSDDFQELDCSTREITAQLKLYLTEYQLVVAAKNTDKDRPKLAHLRTHDLKKISIEQDTSDNSIMKVTELNGSSVIHVHLYQLLQSSPNLTLWLRKIFQSTREESTGPVASTVKIRVASNSPEPNLPLPPSLTRNSKTSSLPSSYRHKAFVVPLLQVEQQQDNEDCIPIKKSQSFNSLLVTDNQLDVHPRDKSDKKGLKRTNAFRLLDRDSAKTRSGRSFSCPPEEPSKATLTSPSSQHSTSSDNLTSPTTPKEFMTNSTTHHTTIRKGKMKWSPRAREFTRALSARLHTPTSSPKHVSRKRGGSLTQSITQSATLPRPEKSGKKKRKGKSFSTPKEPPGTPTRIKSPGTLLRRFQQKWSTSSTKIEDASSPVDEPDGAMEPSTPGVPGTPSSKASRHTKLYLQNPKELAEELCLMDAEMFREINLMELSNGAWTKKNTKVRWCHIVQNTQIYSGEFIVSLSILSNNRGHSYSCLPPITIIILSVQY